MNYKLAKKLKEAGLTWDDDKPSLSELIEECDNLVEECVYLCGHKENWTAVDGRDGFGIFGGQGSTPEEAVGNLYLELKKNLLDI